MSAEYKDRKYRVVPYDPQWPLGFAKIAEQVKGIYGANAVDIQHIGSTSVPGMAGKPTIDILVIVDDLGKADANISDMERAGFQYSGEFVMERSRLFRIMHDNSLLANIHIFPKDHPHIAEMLGLRDYLRTHQEEALSYSNLKNDLYKKYSDDYASYRKEKDLYMAELKKRTSAGA